MFSFSANDESKTKICSAFEPFYIELAWENNRVQPSDISRPNHWFPHESVWGTTAENLYWWRIADLCLESAFDWSPWEGNLLSPIRSANKMWVVACHQYGLSAVVPPMTFCWEKDGSWFLRLPLKSIRKACYHKPQRRNSSNLWILLMKFNVWSFSKLFQWYFHSSVFEKVIWLFSSFTFCSLESEKRVDANMLKMLISYWISFEYG